MQKGDSIQILSTAKITLIGVSLFLAFLRVTNMKAMKSPLRPRK